MTEYQYELELEGLEPIECVVSTWTNEVDYLRVQLEKQKETIDRIGSFLMEMTGPWDTRPSFDLLEQELRERLRG